VVGTAANLLHGEESSVHADAGYIGLEKRAEMQDRDLSFDIAKKRSEVHKLPEGPERDAARGEERSKAQVRALVEHPFHVVKNLFRHRKVRYRGLAKNTAQLFSLFALANLVLASRLLPPQGISASLGRRRGRGNPGKGPKPGLNEAKIPISATLGRLIPVPARRNGENAILFSTSLEETPRRCAQAA